MANGETYASLSFAFRISPSYISQIVKEVLKHLKIVLVPILMPIPKESDFRLISEGFWDKWQFPNCAGAIDGKHVRIRAPENSGSLYFNYKEFYSIVLLAIVDHNYKFIAVDVGSYGKEGDSGIFQKSTMGKKIMKNEFNFPEPKNLPNSNIILPHFLVGDEAFSLDTFMMKPYARKVAKNDLSKEIFNYRLCRARRVSENAFGLLSQVFRIFYTPIGIAPETCTDMILVACCLHNLLRDGFLESAQMSVHQWNQEENLPSNFVSLRGTGGFSNSNGLDIRAKLTDYFMSQQGAVDWQEQHVTRLV